MNDDHTAATALPDEASEQGLLNTVAPNVTAVILAGGRGQRMGGKDKGWVMFRERPMVCHLLDRITPHVGAVCINANRHLDDYRSLGVPVVEDLQPGYQGPLMGMLTGMSAAKTDWVFFVPCDVPLLPETIVHTLLQAAEKNGVDIAVAHDGERLQPVISLVKRSLLPSLNQWLEDGKRKIDRWYTEHPMVLVPFDLPPQAFANLNTPEELAQLEPSE